MTTSLCDTCYRHIDATVYEKDGMIMMDKECPEHGKFTGIVIEPDAEFYKSLTYVEDGKGKKMKEAVLFEVTDKCQLACPHCYHNPDNRTVDKPISSILMDALEYPLGVTLLMAGAEPTLRPDIVHLTKALADSGYPTSILTNGVKFSKKKFTQDMIDAGMVEPCIGLNHYSYQGKNVHDLQLQGIENLVEAGATLAYIGYTLESYDDLPEVLDEIADFRYNHNEVHMYRIRCGAFIGRSSDLHRNYLSTLYNKVMELTNGEATVLEYDNNLYHVMIEYKGKKIRLIQWPDVTTVDMNELNMGPWCEFVPGKPLTNFVHQILLRDASKNMGKELLDTVPDKYTYESSTDKHYEKSLLSSVG
jgi:uncharacterized radical SAM superfamily Fe-S cluster-containing enzyme